MSLSQGTGIGLPNISVAFKQKANTAIRSLNSQTVAVIIAGETENTVNEFRSATEAETLFRLSNLSEKAIDFIESVFEGSFSKGPAKVIVSCAPLAEDALLALYPYSFDWLCGYSTAEVSEGDTTEDISSLIIEKAGEFRSNGKYCKAVVAGDAGPDKEYIVHFATSGIKSEGHTYTAEEYTGRIAGILASLPLSQSCTYFMLPEVDSVSAISPADAQAEISSGKLILINDGEVVRIARGVTSATSGGEAKIKVQCAKDKIENEIKQAIKDSYIGKYTNTYDNKCLLIAALRNYLTQIAKQGLIQDNFEVGIDLDSQTSYLSNRGTDTSELSEQEIKEANTGDEVFIAIKLSLLDAMEDFTINISNE